MIARIWRGAARSEDGDAYAAYIGETGLAGYATVPGNRGAWLLRREAGGRTEFVTLSLWDSRDAIRAFAGDDVEAAVYYPEDDRYLIEHDEHVTHYEVVGSVEKG
jgi:heme-degrading monooxygenase HmoA